MSGLAVYQGWSDNDPAAEIESSIMPPAALVPPNEAALSNHEIIRKALLDIIQPLRDRGASYKDILDVLDNSGRLLTDDRLFRKWIGDYGIQCWSDIAKNEEVCALFQKFLSTECPRKTD